jgi:hypothetical protein
MKSISLKLFAVVALFISIQAKADHIGWGDDNMYVVDRQILCESNSYNPAACGTGLESTQSIYLSQQISKSACIQGSTYNFYGDRINVSGGCRAYFVARGLTSYPQSSDQIISQPHPMTTVTFSCSSQDYKTATCAIPLHWAREVYLSRQLSHSACIEGSSYRIFDRYVEVSQGCRAEFTATGKQ